MTARTLERCQACERPFPPEVRSRSIPTPLEPHMRLLLELADEFDSYDREQHFGAVAFVDWLALNVAAAGGYSLPAGRPGRRSEA